MEQNLRGPCPYVWTGIKSPFCFMSYRASRLNSRCYTPHIWAKSLLMPQYCIVNMLCVWKVILAVSWETLQAFSLEVKWWLLHVFSLFFVCVCVKCLCLCVWRIQEFKGALEEEKINLKVLRELCFSGESILGPWSFTAVTAKDFIYLQKWG